VSSVVGIVSGVVAIWEAVRRKINANKTDAAADRHYKSEVQDIRVEVRRIDRSGQLVQTLVIRHPVAIPIAADVVANALTRALE
jgi:hypothetical protein